MQAPVTPSPLQFINEPLFRQKQVCLYLKRDDLIHPQIQGNKWRKLKYNLIEARSKEFTTLLTFGGPYSNHVYSTASAARMFGFRSIGIIRGEEPARKSPTLLFAAKQGMELYYMNKGDYKLKNEPESIENLRLQLGDFYHIPEGGTNLLALAGVSEIIEEIDTPYDYLATAVGTGGTLAGMLAGLKGKKRLIGFSALKGDDTLTHKVNDLAEAYTGNTYRNFEILFDYHWGGYAKVKPELISFICDFRERHNIVLEPVYNGKMMYGLYCLIAEDYFPKGSIIIAIHTGGLQGLCGFENYFPGWSSEYFS